jgi:hypothetical protein
VGGDTFEALGVKVEGGIQGGGALTLYISGAAVSESLGNGMDPPSAVRPSNAAFHVFHRPKSVVIFTVRCVLRLSLVEPQRPDKR